MKHTNMHIPCPHTYFLKIRAPKEMYCIPLYTHLLSFFYFQIYENERRPLFYQTINRAFYIGVWRVMSSQYKINHFMTQYHFLKTKTKQKQKHNSKKDGFSLTSKENHSNNFQRRKRTFLSLQTKKKKIKTTKKKDVEKKQKRDIHSFPHSSVISVFHRKKKEKKNLGHSLFFERKSMFIPLKNFLLINPFLKSFNPLSITRYLYKIKKKNKKKISKNKIKYSSK